MSDITSGYNIAKNIYFEPEFNDLCGFTNDELENVVKKIAVVCDLEQTRADQALDLMKNLNILSGFQADRICCCH